MHTYTYLYIYIHTHIHVHMFNRIYRSNVNTHVSALDKSPLSTCARLALCVCVCVCVCA